jgi:hypothetical protein
LFWRSYHIAPSRVTQYRYTRFPRISALTYQIIPLITSSSHHLRILSMPKKATILDLATIGDATLLAIELAKSPHRMDETTSVSNSSIQICGLIGCFKFKKKIDISDAISICRSLRYAEIIFMFRSAMCCMSGVSFLKYTVI